MSLKILNVLNNHDIFGDDFLTEIKSHQGASGARGRRIFLGKDSMVWLRSDGRIESRSFHTYTDHWDVVKTHGKKCGRKGCRCQK